MAKILHKRNQSLGHEQKKIPPKTLTGSGGGEDLRGERERGDERSQETLASPVLFCVFLHSALPIREGVFAHAFLEVSSAVVVAVFCDTTRTPFWF
jgi:hypothetical protein